MERRDFMRGVLAVPSAGPFAGKALGASDRIRVGQVGLGDGSKYESEVCMQNPGCPESLESRFAMALGLSRLQPEDFFRIEAAQAQVLFE